MITLIQISTTIPYFTKWLLLFYIILSQKPHGIVWVGVVIIPKVQMRKQKFEGVKWLTQGHVLHLSLRTVFLDPSSSKPPANFHVKDNSLSSYTQHNFWKFVKNIWNICIILENPLFFFPATKSFSSLKKLIKLLRYPKNCSQVGNLWRAILTKQN